MSDRSYRFTHAVTRKPPRSAVRGLRATDVGDPDIDTMLNHHDAYVAALKDAGVEVMVLESLEDHPDSLFVEDTALCLGEGAVVLRPGAPTRLGEAQAMAPHLAALYGDVAVLEGPGCVEGGDILTTESEILIGRSERSDSAGISELARIVAAWGYTVREVRTPPGVLHFKSDCSLLDGNTILSTKTLSDSGCFDGYRVIDVVDGEEPAANSIRVNDVVFMPRGFPQTITRVRDAGFEVVELDNSECQKIDGGLSCLSLRMSPL